MIMKKQFNMKHLFFILFIQCLFVHLNAQSLGKNIAYSDDNVRFTVISDGVMRLNILLTENL